MGLLGSLFGKEKEYPPMDQDGKAAQRIQRFRPQLESFVGNVKEKLELVPADEALYAFVGKPPGAFGMVWWQDGQQWNFKKVVAEKGLPQTKVQLLSDALRDIYKSHQEADRFSSLVAGRKLTVTPSDALADDIAGLLGELEHPGKGVPYVR